MRRHTRFPRLALFRWGFLLTAFGMLASGPAPSACTTAVVTGAATANGRPLLWKNRDSDDRHNQVVYCDDGRYPYVGLVDTGDAAGMQIWAGINSQGFAIMNSASYNLGKDETNGEGAFMKLALQSCATVQDFQALLEKTNPGGRDVSANFGVIDAKGGAAYFETGKTSYKRYNADDPAIAPQNFLVRTNYSESGDPESGTGFLRHDRAVSLLGDLEREKKLDAQSLLATVARDTANVRLDSFPAEKHRRGAPEWAYVGDSIDRAITSAAVVFEGVRPGQDPRLATAWVILGQPVTGVAVPLWVAAGGVPSELGVSPEAASLNEAFADVGDVLYPDERGELKNYLSVDALSNPKTGLLAGLVGTEALNFRQEGEAVQRWAANFPAPSEVLGLEKAMARESLEAVKKLLQERQEKVPTQPRPRHRQPPPKPALSVTPLAS